MPDRRWTIWMIGVAVAVDGVAFGVLARTVGFDLITTIAFSALAVSGSAQFATISLVATGAGPLVAGVTVLLLNSRYVPMGISVAPLLRGKPWWRALAAQLVYDESWAAAQVAPGRWDRRLLFTAGAAVYLGWVAGTALGALGAAPIHDPKLFGLDAVFPAFFLALLVPHLSSKRRVFAALTGATIALVLTPFTPPGVPILAAGLGCLFGLKR